MRVIDRFTDISIDLLPIGLIMVNVVGYFCTPKNAITFARHGVDGIHFCIIPDENDLTLERSPVYVVSPMMPDHYVEAAAENFYDFISLVIEAKDAGALECISYLTKEKFTTYLRDIQYDNSEVKKAVSALSDTFQGNIKRIDDIYSYVKKIQAEADPTIIQYSEEYYDLIG